LLVFSDTATHPQEKHISCLCSLNELESSHQSCRLSGVPIELEKPQVILPEEILASRLTLNAQLIGIISSLVNPIILSDLDWDYIFILCDPHLVSLKIYATAANMETAVKDGIMPGTVFTKKSCGTNAFSLSHTLGRVVAVRGDQHYCRLFKELYCVAGPVKDPGGGILGYLDISRPDGRELNPSVVLIKTLITAAEKEILYLSIDQTGTKSPESSQLPPEIEKDLTPREREICRLLLKRLSSKEIATTLNLSVSTVRTHRKNVYQKLSVNGLTGLLSMVTR